MKNRYHYIIGIALLLSVSVLTSSVHPGLADAATLGPNYPGTGANDATLGVKLWTNPGNITLDDGSYATTNGAFDSGNDISDNRISIVKSDGSIGTTNKSAGVAFPTTVAYASYGSSSDLWGETWAASDINNSNFGVVLQIKDSLGGDVFEYLKGTNYSFSVPAGATINGIQVDIKRFQDGGNSSFSVAHVDTMRITVTYTAAAGGTTSITSDGVIFE